MRGATVAASAVRWPAMANSASSRRCPAVSCASSSSRATKSTLRQGLVVVEAMKMENEIAAAKAGRVKEVAVEAGQSVEAGRLLGDSLSELVTAEVVQEPPAGAASATGPERAGRSGDAFRGARARVRGRKRRFAKRWSRRTSLLVIAGLCALVVTFFTIDIGRISIFGASIRTAAEKTGSKYLERTLHIGRIVGHLSDGSFEFDDVVIEGPTKDDKPFFAAKRIFVNVPWWTIFRKDLYIDINIYDWAMVVEKFPDGQVHLPKLVHKPKEGEKSGGSRSRSGVCPSTATTASSSMTTTSRPGV